MNTPESFSFWVTDTANTYKFFYSNLKGGWRTIRKPEVNENSEFEGYFRGIQVQIKFDANLRPPI